MTDLKILLLVAKDGYAFVNQANALSVGLTKLKVQNTVVRITEKYPEEMILNYNPTVVIGVGSWHSYVDLVEKPLSLGLRVIPWLVADWLSDNKNPDILINKLNKLKFFLTTSKHCKDVFVKYGITENNIGVLYEAVDPGFWKKISGSDFESFLKLISINDGVHMSACYDLVEAKNNKIPIMFTTGGNATDKGVQEILKALSIIDQKIPWIYIIKTWPSPKSFQKSAEELQIVIKGGMLEKVRYFSGEFSKEFIRNLMNVCDIYVACSRSEGFGLPLVEAQMCGKPVVTMRATSTQEVVEDGVGGLICRSIMTSDGPRADIKDLSKILERILINERLRVITGEKAKLWATKRFAPIKIALQLLHYLK